VTIERWIAAAAAGALLLFLALLATRARRTGVPPVYSVVAFISVWGLSLGLFAIPWIRYSQTHAEAWLAIYASIACFLAGAFLACRVRQQPPEDTARPEELSLRRVHIAWLATGTLALLGFALFIRAIELTVGWQTLLEDPALARRIQRTAEFEDAYGFGRALSYLSPVSLLLWTVALREKFFIGRWRTIALLEVFVLVPFLFLGERLSLLTAATWIAAFHLVWRPVGLPRRVLAIGLALVTVGLAYFYAIGSQKDATIEAHPEIRSELTTRTLESLALPYVYSTANIPVFSRLSDDPLAPTTYGQLTILPVVKAAHRLLPLDGAPPEYGAFYPIPFDSYNSATWLGPFYRDFGLIGCLILPALVGFLTTFAVLVARRRRTLLSCWLAALGLGVILFSPLKSQLQDGGTWALLLLGPIASAFLVARPGRRSHESMRSFLPSPFVRRVLLASGLVAALGAAAAAGLGATTTPADEAVPTEARLAAAKERLERAGALEGPASSSALATRLGVSDPSGRYEAMARPTSTPAPGVVGVFWGDGALRLVARARNGELRELVGVRRDDALLVLGPRPVRAPGVRNGGFEEALVAWSIVPGSGAEVSWSSQAYSGRHALRLRFAGTSPRNAGTVTQVVDDLQERAAGTRYILREMVRRTGLSRQVVAGFQFLYSDDTSEYVPAATRASGERAPQGILAGSSERWQPVVASAIASKPVSRVRIFAVDSGREPLRGVIHLDDVSLGFSR
jgi:oligosaccharide repeat unit polymerase